VIDAHVHDILSIDIQSTFWEVFVFLRWAGVRSGKSCEWVDESSQSIASRGNGWPIWLSFQMKAVRPTMAKEDETPRTNPPEIESLIEQIRGTNLDPRAKEKVERLLRAVLTLVELLQRKNASIKTTLPPTFYVRGH
jgi:hypothetical protein